MRNPYAGFFSKQIIGAALINDHLFSALRDEISETFGLVTGECVLDHTGTGVGLGLSASADAIGERVLDVTGSRWCISESGAMVEAGTSSTTREYESGSYSVDVHNPAWFNDVPFNNTNAVTSYVYLGVTSFPVDVHVATDGSRGYGVWADAAGFTVVPTSITLNGSGQITVKLDGVLTALGMQHWTTAVSDSSRSMQAVVWLDTSVSGVSIHSDDPEVAVAFGRLVKDTVTGGWKVDITAVGDGKLGQTTASTTAANYKVTILGPMITNSSALQSDSNWVFIGTSLSSGGKETISTSGQSISVPSSVVAAGFAVDHESDQTDPNFGRHIRVTAPADSDLSIRVDSGSDRNVIITNVGAGQAILVVEDTAQIPAISQTSNFLIDVINNGSNGEVRVRNSGSQSLDMYVEGSLSCTTASGGTGIILAETGYQISGTGLVPTLWDALTLFKSGFHHSTGGGFLQYNNGGGTVNYIWVDGSITGVQTLLVPIHPPDGYTAKEIRVHQYQTSAGSPNVRVAIGRWAEGAGTPTNLSGWQACSTKSDAFVTDSLSLGAGHQLNFSLTEKFYLMVEVTNNGVAVDTARVARVLMRGTMSNMPYFQQ